MAFFPSIILLASTNMGSLRTPVRVIMTLCVKGVSDDPIIK